MFNFSFGWFRKNQEVTKEVVAENATVVVEEKPYRKMKLVNDVITIVFRDGNIISKSGMTQQDFVDVRNAQSEEEILDILTNEETKKEMEAQKVENQRVENIVKGYEVLFNITDDVYEENGSVYFKGISRSVPSLLVKRLCEIAAHYAMEPYNFILEDEEYVALKRFFMWCCLNPRAEVVDKLYEFLETNNMKITRQGFFVALRNVVKVEGADTEYVAAITNAYQKVRAIWKKNPVLYTFYRNTVTQEYGITKSNVPQKEWEMIGNLNDLYINLPSNDENRFTDNHTRTFDIRIGKPVSMKPEECNWSTDDCGHSGLHFGSHTAAYVLCGDTTVFTLHNPMKVVGIGSVKGRCYEYLPFMVTTVQEADEIMKSKDFDFLQLDEQYAIDELENLNEKVREGFAAEARKYEFNFPTISTKEVSNIISSLEEMKASIENRVVKV